MRTESFLPQEVPIRVRLQKDERFPEKTAGGPGKNALRSRQDVTPITRLFDRIPPYPWFVKGLFPDEISCLVSLDENRMVLSRGQTYPAREDETAIHGLIDGPSKANARSPERLLPLQGGHP